VPLDDLDVPVGQGMIRSRSFFGRDSTQFGSHGDGS
jgi:hypothetical protein